MVPLYLSSAQQLHEHHPRVRASQNHHGQRVAAIHVPDGSARRGRRLLCRVPRRLPHLQRAAPVAARRPGARRGRLRSVRRPRQSGGGRRRGAAAAAAAAQHAELRVTAARGGGSGLFVGIRQRISPLHWHGLPSRIRLTCALAAVLATLPTFATSKSCLMSARDDFVRGRRVYLISTLFVCHL